MRYKPLGRSGVEVSVISFGSMRYRSEQNAYEVINRGLDLGLNYIDTSTGYVEGNSEKWSGSAVRKRRGEIYFSSKGNWNTAPDADAVRRTIDKSLAAAGLDYFDFYQLWGLTEQATLDKALAPGGFVEGVRKAQAQGLIRHGLGFTFHGDQALFRNAVDSGEFCCATVSYNLMKRAEEDNIAYAQAKGVGTIVMNPLAGGMLAMAGDEALDFLRRDSAGSWWGALRFLLANPGVTTSIVGLTTPREVEQAAAAVEGSESLGQAYRDELIACMDRVRFTEGNFCTGCEYCKDCPHGFNPSRFMQVMRDFARYSVEQEALRHWIESKYPHHNIYESIRQCIECGQCESNCPQQLEIVEAVRRGKAALGID